jgi:hypothetical protein
MGVTGGGGAISLRGLRRVARGFSPNDFLPMTPSRTPRKKRLWWVVLGAVVALVGAVWLMLFPPQHRPVARVPLPDGTELRLEYVTYGTEHRVPGMGKFRSWVSGHLQNRWPRLGVTWGVVDYSYQSENPRLYLWFTHYDPRSRKFLFDPINQLAVEEVNALEGTPYFVNHNSGAFADLQSLVESQPPMPHVLVSMGNYERRRPVVHMRVKMQGQTAELTVPNPAAKLQFPVWKAEPLPQTRRIGKLDVVVRGLKTWRELDGSVLEPDDAREGRLVTAPEIEVLHDGEPSDGLHLWSTFADATGNSSTDLAANADRRPMWPLSERAWKLRVTTLRKETYPFEATEGVMLGPVPLPEPQKYHVFALPKEEMAEGLRLAVLLGPGRYVWRDGAFVEVGEAISDGTHAQDFLQAGPPQAIGEGDVSVWIHINTTTPAFVVLFVAEDETGKWAKAFQNVVRFQCGSPDFSAWTETGQASRSFLPPKFSAGRSGALCYQLGNPFEQPPGKPGPPPGTPTTVQIVPVDRKTVEFFVEPPVGK